MSGPGFRKDRVSEWDFNRSISDIYSAVLPSDKQGEVAHRFILGLYDMLDKLGRRYPNMLIEGCCGGGGRFDAGMLYYSPQIWGSDNTDAVERLTIQYGSSFCYPISAIGSHVSQCLTSRRGGIPLSIPGLLWPCPEHLGMSWM